MVCARRYTEHPKQHAVPVICLIVRSQEERSWMEAVRHSQRGSGSTTAFKAKMETGEAALGTAFSLRELRPYERQQVRYRGRLSRLLPVSCLSFARRLLR